MKRVSLLGLLLVAAGAECATFTVTNTSDSGPGSLRDAVANANITPPPNTIDFGVNGTITLTTGAIQITAGPLTITGPGAANLTIDGNLNNRIFSIIEAGAPPCPATSGPSDYQVTISGLTLQNAQRNVANSSGGAIFSAKTLALDSVVVRDSGAKSGGGVSYLAQHPGQSLTITNSVFTGNLAFPTVAGNTGSHNGGALHVSDYCAGARSATTVTIQDTVFNGNRVQPGPLQGLGGAIAIFDNATATLTRIRVFDNGIDRPNPPGAFSYPGGGIVTTTTSVTISDSEIADNYAQNSGAISVNADDPTLQDAAHTYSFKLINSTVSGNVAFNGGGATVVWANVAAEIYNSTIANNFAIARGSSGIVLSKPAVGTYLSPTLALYSTVLGQSRLGGADLASDISVLPATTVNATNSLVQTVCGSCNITLTGSGNLTGIAPLLGQLSFNGGNTRTMPMLAGSPVIDAGSNPLGLLTDQRGAPRTSGALTDIGAEEGAGTCAGFADVSSTSGFCPNVEWLKNRAITLGCTSTTAYCPNNAVIRLAMAAFMNRLGAALSPVSYFTAIDPGPVTITPISVGFCATSEVPAAPYPRAAIVSARVAGLADGNFVAWKSGLTYSADGGLTWNALPTQVGIRASAEPNQWSSVAPNTVFQMASGVPYRFTVGLLRDDVLAGSTGNFVQSHCQIKATIVNQNGAASPF